MSGARLRIGRRGFGGLVAGGVAALALPRAARAEAPARIVSLGGAVTEIVAAVEVLKAAGVRYVALPEEASPEGVLAKIALVGAEIGRPAEAAELSHRFEAGMAAAHTEATQVTAPKRVLFVLALQGGRVMAGGEGSSGEAIIHLAGGVNAASGFQGYKQMTDEAVIEAAPEVILMMDREGDLALSDADILGHAALGATPAARAGAVTRMDGMLLLGFGPRTPQAVRALHAALYAADPMEG